MTSKKIAKNRDGLLFTCFDKYREIGQHVQDLSSPVFLCLVLRVSKIESRNILNISKSVHETSGAKVVKTGMFTKWLRQKAMKLISLSSFLLLAKPQGQTAKEEIFKKPKAVSSVGKNKIVPYHRLGGPGGEYKTIKNKWSRIFY